MCKHTCLDCVNFRAGKYTLFPKEKEIPSHCVLHPRYFKKWWKENGSKRREDAEQPKCLELNEHLKSLNEMIRISDKILESLNNGGKEDEQ